MPVLFYGSQFACDPSEKDCGLDFDGAIFSNITHDHLDYHKTFKAYIEAKKAFFDRLPAHAFALTNADDKNGLVMLQNTRAHRYTYSCRTMADFTAKVLEKHLDGTLLRLDGEECGPSLPVISTLTIC